MNHLDLFSGIGGFALAVDRVWPNSEHIFCDTDLFCQAVLRKHWPNSKIYGDIRTITNTDWNRLQEQGAEQQTGGDRQLLETITDTESGQPRVEEAGDRGKNIGGRGEERIDLLTGGFPCQPFSQAGRRGGTADNRHLWPEMLRVIQLTTPTWVIAENVRGLLTIEQGVVFEQVCFDLEASGYEVQPLIIPAVSINAPHRRDRVWFIGYTKSERYPPNGKIWQGKSANTIGTNVNATNTTSLNGEWSKPKGNRPERSERTNRNESWNQNWLEVATRLCRVDDGLSGRVDRLKSLGNSIVPQVAVEIMKAIKQTYA